MLMDMSDKRTEIEQHGEEKRRDEDFNEGALCSQGHAGSGTS